MPDSELTTFTLPPNGDRVTTPELDPANNDYRFVVEGTVRSSYDGREFDALYRTNAAGEFVEHHSLLQWNPPDVILGSSNTAAHRYVFRLPANAAAKTAGVRVDVDQLVSDYLIPPSEVKAALSGSFHVSVLQAPLAPASPWTTAILVGLPAAAVMTGVGLVIRRRIALRGLSDDLAACLVRIEEKSRVAKSALGRDKGRAQPLADRLGAVRDGAAALVRQVQGLRDSQLLVDRPSVEKEVQALRDRAFKMKDTDMRREAEAAMLEKSKALQMLDELNAAETRSAMRLTKIEAILDSACLSLRASARGPIETRPEEALQRELDAEVRAIREVTREMEEVRELSVGLVGR
jgi:hypothetical protein